LLPVLALSGCAIFEDFLDSFGSQAIPAPVPLSERPVQDPVSANHFVLASAEQSVVGVPQVVFTTREDTLSDLARTYGLGYDELIAANPDVDP
jgi:L,D-transpeptidase ErfK/SrfK